MDTLGGRIKHLRKQKKMTLEALAGEALTKGMVSLIENNKANPSMESLNYIAERLGVDVATLLETVSAQELRDVLEEAEKLYNIDYDKKKDKYKRLIELIGPYIEKLNEGYESARLLEMYSYSLYREELDGWEETSDRAAIMYEKMNLVARRAHIGIFRANRKFIDHDYAGALKILEHEREEIESKFAYIDPMTQVDFDYHESVIHFAVGDYEAATRYMEEAIEFSKKNKIFYLIDDLYRLAAGYAMVFQDEEKKEYYLEKLRLYGEFADDMLSICAYHLMKVEALLQKEEYVEAINTLELHFKDPKSTEVLGPWYNLEMGVAQFGIGEIDNALQSLEKVYVPEGIHHPIDITFLSIADSFKGLCHLKLGNDNEALEFAKRAKLVNDPLPKLRYKDLANKIYRLIKIKI